MAASKRAAFRTGHHDQAFLTEFTRAGYPDSEVKAAVNSGFSWFQLFLLMSQFGLKYGGELLTIANAVEAALKSPNQLVALEALEKTYGPDIVAMAQAIASMLGYTLPPLPAPTPVKAKEPAASVVSTKTEKPTTRSDGLRGRCEDQLLSCSMAV